MIAAFNIVGVQSQKQKYLGLWSEDDQFDLNAHTWP